MLRPKSYKKSLIKWSIFLFAGLNLIPGILNGQSNIDSLLNVYHGLPEKSSQASIIAAELANQYRGMSLDSAWHYADLGVKLSENQNFREGLVKNLIQLGFIAMDNDSLNQSYSYFKSCLQYFESEIPRSDKLDVYSELGYLEDIRSNITESLKYYYEGLLLAEEIADDSWLGVFKNNMALLYKEQLDYKKALIYFNDAQVHFKKSENYSSIVRNAYTNLTNYFIDIMLEGAGSRYINKKSRVK